MSLPANECSLYYPLQTDAMRRCWEDRNCRLPVVTLVVLIGGFLISQALQAQSTLPNVEVETRAEIDTSTLVAKSANVIEAGGPLAPAIKLLESIRPEVLKDSSDMAGAVGYWLGRAYEEQGRRDSAISVWSESVRVLRESGKTHLPLFDEYIYRSVDWQVPTEYRQAQRAYLEMLERSTPSKLADLSAERQKVLKRHLRELCVVVPRDVQRRTGLEFDQRTYEVSVDLEPQAGAELAGWWRSQDRQPATRLNERLQEHFRRVLTARNDFVHNGRLDDRGKTYIRLGQPGERTRAMFTPSEEALDGPDQGLKDHEFWTYEHVDEEAHYLFVKDGKTYEIGGVNDLFPSYVTAALQTSSRDAVSYLSQLHDVLRDLATFHGDYGLRASEVFSVYSRAREGLDVSTSPGAFAKKMEQRNEVLKRQHDSRRSDHVPRSYSSVGASIPDLPVHIRMARFLTSEGKTRVELYWSVKTAELSLTEDQRERIGYEEAMRPHDADYIINFSGLQEDRNHRDDVVRYRRFAVSGSDAQGGVLNPRTVEIPVDDRVFHVGVQVGQYSVQRREDGSLEPHSVIRRHTERIDTVRALNHDPSTLEMSDLKLLTVPKAAPAEALTSDEAIPYPFDKVDAAQPVAISFDIYHLAYGKDDRTRYSVSYEVQRRMADGGLKGLFGGEEQEETVTTTTYQGHSRTAEEYILLDMEEFLDEESVNVQVTVRITDETTGQEVVRSIGFEAVSPETE